MELWDVYDDRRMPLHKTHQRGKSMGEGENHVAVGVIVFNSRGEILITRRSAEKRSDPGKWENTIGSVLAGEDSQSGAARELFEETGIQVQPEELHFLQTVERQSRHCFVDIFIVHQDVSLDDLTLQPGETCGARWVAFRQWKDMLRQKDVVFAVQDHFGEFIESVKRFTTQYLRTMKRQ